MDQAPDASGIALSQASHPHPRSARLSAPAFQRAGRVSNSKTMPSRRTRPERHFDRAARAALAISGALISLIGFVLALGGYLSLEGSAFDVLAGLGLILCGSLLSGRHRAGAWTYMFVFAGTVSWSLRNIAVGSSPAHQLIGRPAGRDRAAGSPDRLRNAASGHRKERTSAMMYDWQTSLRASDHHAVRILPPTTVEETGWDILLALHSDRHCRLGLQKLASMVSVPDASIDRWLGALEERKLIAAARHPSTDELLAVLTKMGRGLLDRYFSATTELQLGAHS